MTSYKKKAFTLIELLMVIAIIGILAGILIPTVGIVREKAIVTTSKARLAQYMTAIQSFKGEYKYYPFSSLLDSENGWLDLSDSANSEVFYETLMARDLSDPSVKVAAEGNRRRIQFYPFSEDELSDGFSEDSTIVENSIIDGFGNNRIIFAFDHDNDGVITVPDPEGSSSDTLELRTSVTAFVQANETLGSPAYYLYE